MWSLKHSTMLPPVIWDFRTPVVDPVNFVIVVVVVVVKFALLLLHSKWSSSSIHGSQ